MGEREENLMLFVGGNILHVSNLKIDSSEIDKWNKQNNFTVSCKFEDNKALRNLFGKIEGTSETQYNHFPRKLKKAMKKLSMCNQRITRRMNYLMQKE